MENSGCVVGVDFGTVRIGLAISDQERRIASPLSNYTRRKERLDAEYFQQLVREERVTLFVVGLPLYPSGDESPKSKEARDFGAWLEKTTGIPVEFHDERLSSKLADDLLAAAPLSPQKRKAKRDMLAAYVILTSWLEKKARNA